MNLSLTLANIALKLSEMLQEEVKFVTDCIGEEVAKAAEELPKGKVLLLENVRFYPEEELNNDPEFAFNLVKNVQATIFVNDGFRYDIS